MTNYNFIKVGSCVPKLKVADCIYNVDEMLKCIFDAHKKGVKILSFPELSLTGYTCADLFHQSALLQNAEQQLSRLLQMTSYMDMLIIVGMPVQVQNQKLNCAIVFHKGNILGVVPKTHLPNYSEFYEKRWFTSGFNLVNDQTILCGQEVPISTNIIFQDKTNRDLSIAIEICEDLWTVIPPSSYHALHGATIIINPSASNELVGKQEYRKSLIEQQSARTVSGYIYTSSGVSESTTDVVFSGSAMIVENGKTLIESKRFSLNSELIISEIDVEYLSNHRMKNAGFNDSIHVLQDKKPYKYIEFEMCHQSNKIELTRHIDALPFIPLNSLENVCEEILNIQAHGLIKRLSHIGCEKIVVGVSGGLDSTLALLVMVKAYEIMGIDKKNIIGITMPGFGTSNRTYDNAIKLMDCLDVTKKEISIKDACVQHFKDIELPNGQYDVTYENSQARERTQILMDYANKVNGIVIGTGNLSELALGWATYNGDHMSMYAVNSSVPKTLVKYLVQWVANQYLNDIEGSKNLAGNILYDILGTPISPELLPPTADGDIQQKTEDIVGQYDLNDFFLFNVVKCGFSPLKIIYLANIAFKNKYNEEHIVNQLKTFYKRFFTQQFKRSCLPDGVKVGSVSLSPRGDWRMPSDASYNIWMKELEDHFK